MLFQDMKKKYLANPRDSNNEYISKRAKRFFL